jgi:integrase
VLSGVFSYAKNEGAYDGFNPVQGAMIPRKAREPEETYAFNMVQILRILQILPLFPKANRVPSGTPRGPSYAGWNGRDYTGEAIAVNRSVWKGVVNRLQTRTSRQPVPVIPKLANLLDEYRASMGDPTTGAMFHNGSGESMDMDKLAQRVIRPAVEAIGLRWFGWHGFRRGIASNLYQLAGRAADSPSRQATRHQRPLHQGF